MHLFSRVLVLALCLVPSLAWAQDTWDVIGPNGGWVNDLHRDANGRILATASFGGIYRSSDDAESWQQIYTGTLVFDPRCVTTNAAGHVFVGSEGIAGVGFLRSTDDGATWQVISNSLSSTLVRDLLVAPNQNIFACTANNGAYRSTNDGTTFTQLSGLPSTTSVVEATPTGDLFVGAEFATGNLFRSTDGGASWQQSDTGIGSDVLDIHASGSALYAIDNEGVYRSTDNGASWTNLNAPAGLGYNSVTVASNGDICVSRYELAGGRVYRSTDGGASWTQDSGLPGHAVDGLLGTPGGPIFIAGKGPGVYRHPGGAAATAGAAWEQKVTGMVSTWIADIAHDPASGYLYAATQHIRVLRSSDGGASWESASNGIEVYEQMNRVAVNTDGTIFASTSSNGIYRSTDQGANWANVYPAGATALACNPQGQVFAGYGSRVYRSTDNGTTWTQAILSTVANIADIAFDGTTVYAACGAPGGFGSKGVYRSTDNGTTWAAFNSGLTDLNVTCVAVGEPSAAKASGGSCRISVGTKATGMFDLDEGTGIWAPNPDTGPVTVVDIFKPSGDDLDGLRALAARLNNLMILDGCGAAPIPNPLSRLVDLTMVRSVCGSCGPPPRKSGAPEVVDLIGTIGSGILRRTPAPATSVSPAEPPATEFIVRGSPNPFSRRTAIEFELASRQGITLKIFDASGREVATLVDGWKDAGPHSIAWEAAGLPSGVYFSQLSTAAIVQTGRLVLVR